MLLMIHVLVARTALAATTALQLLQLDGLKVYHYRDLIPLCVSSANAGQILMMAG